MNALRECWKQNVEGLERLSSLDYVPPDYLALRKALYRAQTAACDALTGDCSHAMPIAAGTLPYDPAAMAGMLGAIAGSLGKDTAASADLARLMAVPGELPLLADMALFGPDRNRLNEWAAMRDISEEAALFFGRACGAPYVFQAVYEAPDTSDTDAPQGGMCPCCGSSPGLSLVSSEEGHRELVCSLCGRKRSYPRMTCPFCGKAGILETIKDVDFVARWIEGCESCGHYLKTVDTRLGSVLPLVESVATLYLDLIAEREGFRRGMPYVALN